MRAVLVPLPRCAHLVHPWVAGLVYSPLLTASCLWEQGWLERASGIPCQRPPQQGQGVTLSVPLPHWGGPPHDPPITSYWQSWYWERSGSPGWALLLPGQGLQAGGISPRATPQWGPWSTPGLALVGWARGSVYRQPSLWRREPRGEGGAGASDGESEALGSACLMKERGANRDTEILIRGSLWGGIYYLALIGCVVASQHPGPGREPRNSPR